VKRETQNILLILLGGALVKIAVNGDYLRYVKPAQQPCCHPYEAAHPKP